jgi:hypothetical protein
MKTTAFGLLAFTRNPRSIIIGPELLAAASSVSTSVGADRHCLIPR